MNQVPLWAYLLGILLTSGIVSALMSWRVAIAVSRESAAATRQHAIDTEKLRMRHHVVQRRMEAFDRACTRLMESASFKEVRIQEAANAASGIVTQSMLVAAQDLERVGAALDGFTIAFDTLKNQTLLVHRHEAEDKSLVPLLEDVQLGVCVLSGALDQVLQARIDSY